MTSIEPTPQPSHSSASMQYAVHRNIRIGYAYYAKKKDFFVSFAEHAKTHMVDCVDMVETNFEQEVDILFFKVEESGTSEVSANVKKYISTRPKLTLIEDPKTLEPLNDRLTMYQFFQEKLDHKLLKAPGYVLVTAENKDDLANILKQHNVTFPAVAKPYSAVGTENAHLMCVVFNQEKLQEVINEGKLGLPIAVQQYVNHDAVIYKAYVVGTSTFVQTRHSFRNFEEGETDTIWFDSHKPFPDELKPVELRGQNLDYKSIIQDIKDPALLHKFDKITNMFADTLGVGFYGYDVLMEHKTGEWYTVDINFFPGYTGITNFNELAFKHIIKKYNEKLHNQKLP